MKNIVQALFLAAGLVLTSNGLSCADALHPNGIWYFKPNGKTVTAGALTENDCTAVIPCDAASLNTDVAARIAQLTPYATLSLALGSYPIGTFVLKSGQSIQRGDENANEHPILQGAVKLEGMNLIESVKIDNQGLLVETTSPTAAYIGLYLPAGVSATLRDTDIAVSPGTRQPAGQSAIGLLLDNGASLVTYGGRVSAQGSAATEGITMTGGTVVAKGMNVESSSANGMAYGINAQQNSTFQLDRGDITVRSERGEAVGAKVNDGKLLLSNIDLTVSAAHDDEHVWAYGIRVNAAVVTLDAVNVSASSNGSSGGIRGENGTAVNVTNSFIYAGSGIPDQIENDICAGLECGANGIMLWDSYVTMDNSRISATDHGHGVPSAAWLLGKTSLRTFNSTMRTSTQKDFAAGIDSGDDAYSRHDKAVFQVTAPDGYLVWDHNTFINSTCMWNDQTVACPD